MTTTYPSCSPQPLCDARPRLGIVFRSVLQVVGLAVALSSGAHAHEQGGAAPAVSASPEVRAAEEVPPVRSALEAYDRAFQARDVEALRKIMADDAVMYEAGAGNIGKVDVLDNHLGPELQSFQEVSSSFSDVRISGVGKLALVTRQFSIRGKRIGGPFFFRGAETQAWEFREGRWQLTHLHLSFAPLR